MAPKRYINFNIFILSKETKPSYVNILHFQMEELLMNQISNV